MGRSHQAAANTVPARGGVWVVDLDPTKGNEVRGVRPAVIVSADFFNSQRPIGRVVVVPLTTNDRPFRLHVPINPPEGNLRQVSFAKVEDVRSVSTARLQKYCGDVHPDTMAQIADRLRIVLDL
jgi:mRNA interferase MazF